MEKITIETEYITLSALLKHAGAVSSGGVAKQLILDGLVKVNGETVFARGCKVRPGDIVAVDHLKMMVVSS